MVGARLRQIRRVRMRLAFIFSTIRYMPMLSSTTPATAEADDREVGLGRCGAARNLPIARRYFAPASPLVVYMPHRMPPASPKLFRK